MDITERIMKATDICQTCPKRQGDKCFDGRTTDSHITFNQCPMDYYNNPASRGLGDTVAKVTKAIGIKPCGGCKKRQKKLNDLVPYETKHPDTFD